MIFYKNYLYKIKNVHLLNNVIISFFIKKINLQCNESVCKICKDLKINKFSNCECRKCLRKLDSCDSFDCQICLHDNREIVYNCKCSFCFNSNQSKIIFTGFKNKKHIKFIK